MRKFVVPIVALAGIALLSSGGNAANLIVKSRTSTAGRPVSLPVLVNNVGGTGQLWGVDFAVSYDTAKLSAATDATTGAAFTPQAVTGSTETPVVVSGAPSVGTGATNPTLYVGYVRGTGPMPANAGTGAIPSSGNGIGLLRLTIAAGQANGTVIPLTTAAYNVANDGTGATTINRAAATGATSDTATGAAVTAEAITVSDFVPGAVAPAAGKPDLRVPLHEVAVGKPGDVNANGTVDAPDSGNIAAVLNGKSAATWTEYKRIAADVAPLNGYTASALGGTAGLGYGNGVVDAPDLGLMAAKFNNKSAAANFPVSE